MTVAQSCAGVQGATASAEEMLEQLEEEVKELTSRVSAVMPREVEQEAEKLRRLQEQVHGQSTHALRPHRL